MILLPQFQRFFKPGGNVNKKVNPTVGISFGLPIPSPPINQFLNYNGLSLGPVNVNPFFSLQYTKDDYGQKIIHPSINLHITPNEFLLTKLIGKKKAAKNILLASKLQSLANYQPQPHLPGPIYFDHPGPSFNGPPPPFYDRPFYGPSFNSPPHFSGPSPYNSAPVSELYGEPPFLRSIPATGQPLNFSPENEYAPVYSHSNPPTISSYRKSNSDIVFPETNGKI